MLSRKFGFTLAEVLVTLGIIGVVSAMTIPSLTQNWQKRAYVTQLHKAYSEIKQSFISQMNQKNALNLMEAGLYQGQEKTFAENNFKIVKSCGSSMTPCFASSYRSLSGNKENIFNSARYSCVIGGGAAIGIDFYNISDENDGVGSIYIDINGPKGPNIGGRDMFRMQIYLDGSLDSTFTPPSCQKSGTNCVSGSSAKESRDFWFNNTCKSSPWDVDGGCFGKILNDNWEMKY